MLIAPHAISGLVIAISTERMRIKKDLPTKRGRLIFLSCTLSVGSHFILDMIPHSHYSIDTRWFDYWFFACDLLLTAAVFVLIFWRQIVITFQGLLQLTEKQGKPPTKVQLRFLPLFLVLGLSSFCTILPDILNLTSYYINNLFLKNFKIIHDLIHAKKELEFGTGIYVQVLVTFVFSAILWLLRKKFEIEESFEEVLAWLSENVKK